MRFSRTPASLAHHCREVSVLDVFMGAIAPLLAMLLRDVRYFYRVEAVSVVLYIFTATVATALAAAYFRIGRTPTRFLSRYDMFQALKVAAAASVLTAVIAFTFTRLDMAPRSLPALHFLVLGALLLGSRAVMQERARSMEMQRAPRPAADGENVIIIGGNGLAALYMRMVDCVPSSPHRVLALLDDDARLHGQAICGRIVAGAVDTAPRIVAEYATHGVVVDRILIAHMDQLSCRRAMALLRPFCEAQGIAIEYLIKRLGLEAPSSSRPRLHAAALHAAAPESTAREPRTRGNRGPSADAPRNWSRSSPYWRFRRLVDITSAGAALIVLAPAFCVVALVVLLDVGGPVVFWQERVGYLGRRINVHKFRTLRNPVDRSGRVLSDEERLSPIGRFLRGSRLDELPQLYDIFVGEMTMIGPRPLLPVDLAKGESKRHLVPPGLTGWAQVHGGKMVTAEEKDAMDEWYVRHAGIVVDMRILRLTALVPFRGDRRRQRVLDMAVMEQNAERAKSGMEAARQGLAGAEPVERSTRTAPSREALASSA